MKTSFFFVLGPFVRSMHQDSPHKRPAVWKMCPCHDVIMSCRTYVVGTSWATCMQQCENKANIFTLIPLRSSCKSIFRIQIWLCNPNVNCVPWNDRLSISLLPIDISWISIKVITWISMNTQGVFTHPCHSNDNLLNTAEVRVRVNECIQHK